MRSLLKTKKKITTSDLIVDEIDNTSSNDWNELCEKCSSLVVEANLSYDDIDKIVENVKKELN